MSGLLAPSLALLVILNLYPLVFALSQSVHNGNVLQTGEFVGLQNYTEQLTSPDLWGSVGFTLIFTLAGVLGSAAVGLVLALTFQAGVAFARIFRALLLLPWIVPIVVSAMTWHWLVSTPDSLLRVLGRNLGLGDILFLADPTLARAILCLFEVWACFPFMFLMFSAALEGIDKDLYEAASIDGAAGVSRFRHITWPLIRKSGYISCLLMTIFVFNDFAAVYLLTGGGPAGATETLPVYTYLLVFRQFFTGQGVAVSVMMSIFLIVLATALFRQIRKVGQ